jgi:hypothetical protein
MASTKNNKRPPSTVHPRRRTDPQHNKKTTAAVVSTTDPAVDSLEPALQKAAERVRGLLVEIGVDELLRRYRIGEEVGALSDAAGEEKYGKRAVEKLAHAVGRDASTLYEYRDVVRAFPDKAVFRALAKRKSSRGVPLSFSTFVVLSDSCLTAKMRITLVEQALTDGLTIRQLRSHLPTKKTQVKAPPVLETHVREGEKLLARVDGWMHTLMDLLRQQLATTASAQVLGKLVDVHKRLRDQAVQSTKVLEAEHAVVVNQLPPTARVSGEEAAVPEEPAAEDVQEPVAVDGSGAADSPPSPTSEPTSSPSAGPDGPAPEGEPAEFKHVSAIDRILIALHKLGGTAKVSELVDTINATFGIVVAKNNTLREIRDKSGLVRLDEHDAPVVHLTAKGRACAEAHLASGGLKLTA